MRNLFFFSELQINYITLFASLFSTCEHSVVIWVSFNPVFDFKMNKITNDKILMELIEPRKMMYRLRWICAKLCTHYLNPKNIIIWSLSCPKFIFAHTLRCKLKLVYEIIIKYSVNCIISKKFQIENWKMKNFSFLCF